MWDGDRYQKIENMKKKTLQTRKKNTSSSSKLPEGTNSTNALIIYLYNSSQISKTLGKVGTNKINDCHINFLSSW